MRKFLLTLAVLCGTVSAWAEIYKPGSRTTTLEAGKKYFISVATWYGSGCTNLLYNNGGTLAKSDLLPNVMVNNESYLFTVEEVDENNTYYIKNSEGKYLQSGDLASTETKTGITVVPYNSVKGSVTCGNDVDACDENGNKIAYNDITDETPIVCVYESDSKGWRYINGNMAPGKSTPFAFYEVEEQDGWVEITTNTASPILYTIKNIRANNYATYAGDNSSMTLQSTINQSGNIFYFTQGSVDGTYKIHNLATELLCASHNSWTETGIDWYIQQSGNTTYTGVAISQTANLTDDEGDAWNDFQGKGTSVAFWGGNDPGSVWTIERFDEEKYVVEVDAAKANALTQIAKYEEADYYTYSDVAIATAKATINAQSANDLASAFEAVSNLESALATLVKTEKTGGPIAGDYIQLKNRQYAKFLKANDDNLTGDVSANSNATLWYVEAGEGTNVKLKNVSTGKYIGEIRQSATVLMVDEANAKQFAFTNQTDIYAVFKDITGGNYAYGHIAGHNSLVGWEATANATQWVVSKVVLPEVGKYYVIECPLFYNKQGIRKALYSNGSNPGWKTLDIADKSFYWTVEQTDNGYVLKNANDNKYILGQANNNNAWTMVDATDGAEYIIEPAGEGQVFIKITGRHLHANNHGGGVNNESNIVSWETSSANSASAWKFIERYMPNFYTFKNDEYYITSGVTNNNRIALSTTKDESAIYYYNGTHLLAYKTGLYMGLNATDWTFEAVGSNDISAIEFVPAVNGVPSKINIKSGGRWLHRTEAYVNRCTNNTCGDAHNWSIEEVNSLPFTFKAAALGYATFNAPVTVQLPEGVKAYTSEIQEGNKLKMTELAGGIVPAKTAVLLWNESVADEDVTVNLTITENITFEGKNSFVGTVASENLKAEMDCYSLQQGTKGKVGFYAKSTGTKGGFKAWIEMAKSSEARAFVIIFDGEDATGIKEALGLENENVEIYDLSGRRLDKPAKGVNIIGGKTVIVR